jgi:hypothetical protein
LGNGMSDDVGMGRSGISLALLLAALATAACGGDPRRSGTPSPGLASATPASTATPVATAPSPPQASPTPPPTPAPLLKSSGWLVYLRNRDLYVGSLDDGSETRLTTGGTGAGFAGYTYGRRGVPVLYFARITDRGVSPPGGYGTITVYRQSIGAADAETVFTFVGETQSVGPRAWSNVSASDDGRYIAYADIDGISVYDTTAGTAKRALRNTCVPNSSGVDAACKQYTSPGLSPDGATLLATRPGYETSSGVLTRPFDPDPQPIELNAGGQFQTWSPDGTRICLPEVGIQPMKVGTITLPALDVQDITQRIATPGLGAEVTPATFPSNCLWRRDGGVAVSFIDSAPRTGEQRWRVAVLSLLAGGDADRDYDLPAPYRTVPAWLPDGSGLVISGYAPCVPCGERDPTSAALLLDGTVRALPFEAGVVLGAIPPAPPPRGD